MDKQDISSTNSSAEKVKETISLVITAPGMYTTVQDLGRVGYQQFGMPVAGAMDQESYRLGQALVGNNEFLGALECTMLPPTIKVQGDCVVAFTGADMQPSINGVLVPRYIPFQCREGDIISGTYTNCGMRMYIAFAGGIQVPEINGSVATHTKAKIGGLEGRALQKDDILTIPLKKVELAKICYYNQNMHGLSNSALYNRGGKDWQEPFRVILGSQNKSFTEDGIYNFTHFPYTLSARCDRMGFRLEGAVVEHVDSADIISDGAVFGSIQIPADGQPIVLMADRQTTGGYTKIGTVITPDLPRLSQVHIGSEIHFITISVEEGQDLYKTYAKEQDSLLNIAKQQSNYIFELSK